MDQREFDRIARLLGGAATRRRGLAAALGAALGLAAAPLPGELTASPGAVRARSRRPLQEGPCGAGTRKHNNICNRNEECCTGICDRSVARDNVDGNGRCRCVQRGGACKVDRNCCGGRTCVNRVCASSAPTPAPTPTPPPPPADPCDSPTVCSSGCPQSAVQAAIDAAAAGATIAIGAGVWTESLTIAKNLTVVGCGATVINTGTARTITITGSSLVELRNLTVDGTGQVTLGGGIAVNGVGALTLSGSTVVRNAAANVGGGIVVGQAVAGGSVVMTDNASIDTCRGGIGAGIYAGQGSTLTMSGSSSILNCLNATNYGGGVWMDNGATMTMTGSSTIRGNQALGGAGIGMNTNGPVNTLTISTPATITLNTNLNTALGAGVLNMGSAATASIAAGTVTGNITKDCSGLGISC